MEVSSGIKAISARKEKKINSEDTDFELYDIICEKPGLSAYDYKKLTGWSYDMVQKSIKKLEEIDFIYTKFAIESGKTKKLVYPTDWKDLYELST
ncbi:MAG: hypothetical protein ACE5J9_00880 [Methanosarcinales archaeon]